MTRSLRPAIVTAALFVAACKPEPAQQLGPDAFGLSEASNEHPAASAAITMADDILGQGSSVQFALGWLRPGTRVLVYTVLSNGMAAREVIGTYNECGCVLMSIAGLRSWVAAATGSGAGRLEIEEPALIAYMLLHEAGHVAQGKTPCGIIVGTKSASDPANNMTSTMQKLCEEKADSFAATAIRTALADRSAPRSLTAGRVMIALSQLSWNLQAHRMLDSFGANAVHDPHLFRDVGLSHPNLEWRILSANNMIAPSESSRELLESFEKARTDGALHLSTFHL